MESGQLNPNQIGNKISEFENATTEKFLNLKNLMLSESKHREISWLGDPHATAAEIENFDLKFQLKLFIRLEVIVIAQTVVD